MCHFLTCCLARGFLEVFTERNSGGLSEKRIWPQSLYLSSSLETDNKQTTGREERSSTNTHRPLAETKRSLIVLEICLVKMTKVELEKKKKVTVSEMVQGSNLRTYLTTEGWLRS